MEVRNFNIFCNKGLELEQFSPCCIRQLAAALDSVNLDFYASPFCFSHPVWFLATSSPVPCYPRTAHRGGIHRPSVGRELNTAFRLRNAARRL